MRAHRSIRWLTAVAVSAMLVCAVMATPVASAQPISLPVTVQNGTVVVRAQDGMESLARDVARRAPDKLRQIARDLENLPTPPRVEIRLVKRSADLSRAAPPGRGAPEWASGVAYTDAGVIVVAARNGPETINVSNVVDHELAHIALVTAMGRHVPRWLNEGFAYLHSSDWSVSRVQILTGMVWFGNTTPIYQLDDQFAGTGSDAQRAYAQSYDFVAFLTWRGRYIDRYDDGDRWTFRRFLAAIAAGKSVEQATKEVYNATLVELYEEWRADIRDRYLVMPASLFALAVWVVGAFILILAYRRRRRLNRQTLDRWEREENARDRVIQAAAEALSQRRPS